MNKNTNYRIALTAVLCAQAVTLSFFENLIPPLPFMPPGAKPGFSNLITMFAAGSLVFSQALIITAVKSGFAFITRGATAAAMSFSGGLLSTIAMYFLMKYAKKYIGIVGVSVISALCHNAGQLITSCIITGTSKTLYYAPALAVFGVVTGIITGVIFRILIPALEKQKKYFLKSDIQTGGDENGQGNQGRSYRG